MVEMEKRDVQAPAGGDLALTHISRVKAAVPKAVAGTAAGDASAALLRRMLPAVAAQGSEEKGEAVTLGEAVGLAEGGNEGEGETLSEAALHGFSGEGEGDRKSVV